MTKRTKYLLISLLIAIIFFILLPQTYEISYEKQPCHSYDEIYSHSQFIVKGKFISYLDTIQTINGERFENYSFKIDKILKGKILQNKIMVKQRKCIYMTTMFNNTTEINDELYIKPNIDSTTEYLLFLDYDKEMQCYYPNCEPFIGIINKNKIQLQSNLFDKNIETKYYLAGIKFIIVSSDIHDKISDFSYSIPDEVN